MLRRLLKTFVTIFVVITAVFFLTRISGNPFEREYSDEGLTLEMRNELMEYYGLDKPVVVQYFVYLRELLRGNAGRSLTGSGRPVTQLFGQAFAMTGKLVVWGFLAGPVFGVPLGVIGAVRRNTALGQAVMMLAFVGYAIPGFIIAIGLVFVFSFQLGWLPSIGDATPAHYVLPLVTMSIGSLAGIARYTRSSMLDSLSQDHIRTARGKGLHERMVIYKHALRNVMIPVVTIFGTQLAGLLTGSLIVETIFAWPGFGRLMVSSVQARDYPAVQFGVIIAAIIVITMNLIVDVVYGVIDPRIRTEG